MIMMILGDDHDGHEDSWMMMMVMMIMMILGDNHDGHDDGNDGNDGDDDDDAVNRLTFVDRHYSTCVITQEQGKNTKYAPVGYCIKYIYNFVFAQKRSTKYKAIQ